MPTTNTANLSNLNTIRREYLNSVSASPAAIDAFNTLSIEDMLEPFTVYTSNNSNNSNGMNNSNADAMLYRNFLKELTEDVALKTLRFVGGEIGNVYSGNIRIEKQFDSGLCVISDTSKPKPKLSEERFEQWKYELRLAYIIVDSVVTNPIPDGIMHTENDLVNDLVIVHEYNLTYKLVASTDGFQKQDMVMCHNLRGFEYMCNSDLVILFVKIEQKSVIYVTEYEITRNIVVRDDFECDNQNYLIALIETINDLKRQARRQIERVIQENRVAERKPNTTTKKYRSVKNGSYVKHNIPFSCEIECYGTSQKDVAELSRVLPKEFGMCRDGSLNSRDMGFPIEIQTPILAGKKGEIAIAETLCQKLVERSYKVDKTCGMHVHFDVADMVRAKDIKGNLVRPDALISLYLFHRLFEDVIVSFLPSTRRNNRYCAQFKDGVEYNDSYINFPSVAETFEKMKTIKNLTDFTCFAYQLPTIEHVRHAQGSRYVIHRYMGINFHSLIRDNHIEIRYHSGTINYEKILYWIDLHGSIVQACMEGRINEDILRDIQSQNLSLTELTKQMFSLIDLNTDTVEYLLDRQAKFLNVKYSEEILIDKTKKMGVV